MTRTMFLLGTGWFGFQAFWAFHAGPLPLFLKAFTDSKFTISLVLSLAGLSGCIVPPLAGYWSDRTRGRFGRRRPFVLAGAVVAAACVFALPEMGRFELVGLLAGSMYFAIRLAETPFLSLLPDLTAPEKRSTASGMMNLVGSLGLVACFATSMLLWDEHPIAVFRIVSIGFLGAILVAVIRLDEPSAPAQASAHSIWARGPRTYLAGLAAETSAIRFFIAQFFWWLGFAMVSAFSTLFVVEELGVDEGRSFLVLLPFTIVATLFVLPIGMLGDRFGRRTILRTMIFAWAASQILVGLSRNLTEAVVLVGLSAIPFAAVMGVGYAFMLDLVPEERMAEFVGFGVISNASSQILGPIVGGLLIDGLGYRSIFPAAAALMVTGGIVLGFVRPRTARDGSQEGFS